MYTKLALELLMICVSGGLFVSEGSISVMHTFPLIKESGSKDRKHFRGKPPGCETGAQDPKSVHCHPTPNMIFALQVSGLGFQIQSPGSSSEYVTIIIISKFNFFSMKI